MIRIEKLTEADKGRAVVYTFGDKGVISSWNSTHIFVRYGADVTSKPTRPEDLEWLT